MPSLVQALFYVLAHATGLLLAKQVLFLKDRRAICSYSEVENRLSLPSRIRIIGDSRGSSIFVPTFIQCLL